MENLNEGREGLSFASDLEETITANREPFYSEMTPAEALRPFVDAFWEISIPQGVMLSAGDSLLPHGCIDLIINLGSQPLVLGYGHHTYQVRTHAVVGPRLKQLHFPEHSPVHLFGVRIKPYALASKTGIPLHRLEGQVLMLEDLGLSADWLDEIDLHTFPADLFQGYMEREVLEDWFRYHRNPVLIEKAVEEIIACRGQLTIKELTAKLDVHKSTLEDHFRRYIGIMPKRYARIIRFHYLLSGFLSPHKEKTMTDLAYRLNFSDQAHMIKEFRSMTGRSPGKFFREQGWLWRAKNKDAGAKGELLTLLIWFLL